MKAQGSEELQVLYDCGAVGAERSAFRARHKLLGVDDVLLCTGVPGFSRQGQFSLLASAEVELLALAEESDGAGDGETGRVPVSAFAPGAEKAAREAAREAVRQESTV